MTLPHVLRTAASLTVALGLASALTACGGGGDDAGGYTDPNTIHVTDGITDLAVGKYALTPISAEVSDSQLTGGSRVSATIDDAEDDKGIEVHYVSNTQYLLAIDTGSIEYACRSAGVTDTATTPDEVCPSGIEINTTARTIRFNNLQFVDGAETLTLSLNLAWPVPVDNR